MPISVAKPYAPPKLGGVREPVIRGRVVVWAAHLHTRAPGNGQDIFRRGRKNRIRPVEVFEHGEKWAFDCGGRRLIAPVEPREHARMAAQLFDFGTQGSGSYFDVALLPVRPFLPVVAAGPSGHDQNSLLVREIEKRVRFRGALEADGVEIQIAKVGNVSFQTLEGLRRSMSGAQPRRESGCACR